MSASIPPGGVPRAEIVRRTLGARALTLLGIGALLVGLVLTAVGATRLLGAVPGDLGDDDPRIAKTDVPGEIRVEARAGADVALWLSASADPARVDVTIETPDGAGPALQAPGPTTTPDGVQLLATFTPTVDGTHAIVVTGLDGVTVVALPGELAEKIGDNLASGSSSLRTGATVAAAGLAAAIAGAAWWVVVVRRARSLASH